MDGPDYRVRELYVAPVFSRCSVTKCHPGLYIQGGPEAQLDGNECRLYVVFWLDELFVVEDKARVPRFYTLGSEEEFNNIGGGVLETKEEQED